MNNMETKFAVMFSDVAGSTRLYETLGDATARQTIAKCLECMGDIATKNGGVIIKTIGDELMSRFPSADSAVTAARQIQEFVEHEFDGIKSAKLSVRIGLHYGNTILQDDGDVFGDAVNVAARMAGIAQARQIITTEATIRCLSPTVSDMTRRFDRTQVKGKQEEITVYQVLWEGEEDGVTRMVDFNRGTEASKLILKYQGAEVIMTPDSEPISVGRSSQCNLTIKTDFASRVHATFEYRRGKIVLIDKSANGTFVKVGDEPAVYLRREELPLTGTGLISLGEAVESQRDFLIKYSVIPVA